MKICHIVPSLEKRHGGPSISVPALAAALGKLGNEVELLSTSSNPSRTESRGPVTTRIFPSSWPIQISASADLRRALRDDRAKIIHHHSLWLRTLHYAHRASQRNGVKLVISPRGMMSPWAWNHHRWRKQFADCIIHPGALKDAHGWHATSPEEAKDIRCLGFTQPVCVAPNGVSQPSADELIAARAAWYERCPATRNRPVALFYARFHRKKRLRELLKLWLALPRGEWFLLLVGVPEEYSVAEVRGWITAAGADDRVSVQDGAELPAPYAVASLFLQPSHSENFGLVIAEAMAAGVPTLVTDTTPWAAINIDERGWCVPWENYNLALQAAIAEGPSRLRERGHRAQTWVLREFSWDKSARDLAAFYVQLQGAPS